MVTRGSATVPEFLLRFSGNHTPEIVVMTAISGVCARRCNGKELPAHAPCGEVGGDRSGEGVDDSTGLRVRRVRVERDGGEVLEAVGEVLDDGGDSGLEPCGDLDRVLAQLSFG